MRGSGLDQSPSSLDSSTQRLFPPPAPPNPPWSNLKRSAREGAESQRGDGVIHTTGPRLLRLLPSSVGVVSAVEEGGLPSVVAEAAVGVLGGVPAARV